MTSGQWDLSPVSSTYRITEDSPRYLRSEYEWLPIYKHLNIFIVLDLDYVPPTRGLNSVVITYGIPEDPPCYLINNNNTYTNKLLLLLLLLLLIIKMLATFEELSW